jgi:hypothetical protein
VSVIGVSVGAHPHPHPHTQTDKQASKGGGTHGRCLA